ncbi:MAG TPA: GNAT family N-acetyltransferase [Bryobacteraceae bacterium]|nr:GNAT family N-acetyltransferase [Bryobacteraceae bacterium]
MRIGVRSCTFEDREFLWWLHRETMREYVDKTWGWDETFQRSKFDQNFDPLPLLIIQKDSEPIGYICVGRPGDEIFLAAIEIVPAEQNQGIASQLINEILDEADRSQLPVNLQVLKVNPARRLYERLGFRCTGDSPTHYLMRREPASADPRK